MIICKRCSVFHTVPSISNEPFCHRPTLNLSKSCVMVPFSCSNDYFRLPSRNFLLKILRDGPVFMLE